MLNAKKDNFIILSVAMLCKSVASMSNKGQYTTQYPMQMAGAVLAVIPLVVIFFIFQKQFIESVATSGIKG